MMPMKAGTGTVTVTKNKPRKPKSRSYKDLQRNIGKKREKIVMGKTRFQIADGVGVVAMEDLTAKGKGRGSASSTQGPGLSTADTWRDRNYGDPKGTSITCHQSADKESRISQWRFLCTNDKKDINADI